MTVLIFLFHINIYISDLVYNYSVIFRDKRHVSFQLGLDIYIFKILTLFLVTSDALVKLN